VEAVRGEEVKLRGVGFVKEVGFKPGVKERGSYRCTEWCLNVCLDVEKGLRTPMVDIRCFVGVC